MIAYQTQAGSPVVEIKVNGSVTDADLTRVMTRLRIDLEQNGKHRILEIIDRFSGIEPAAIWTDLRLGLPLVNQIDRVTIVADQSWIRALTNLGRFFTRAEVRSFEPAQIAEARAWIEATT